MSLSPMPSLPRWAGAGGLVVVLVAALVLSVVFAFKVPLGNSPDETTHRDYIRLMVEQKGLITFVPPKGRAPLPDTVKEKLLAREGMAELPEGALSRDETHQPPLYYALAALVCALSGGSVLALRLVAVPFHLATIWVAWRAGKDFFPKRPELALAMAAFVACLPTQAQLGGAISNDAATHFFCALILWRIGRFFAPHIAPPHRAYAWGEGALLGLFFGLGLLTKLTVLQLYPVLFVASVWAVKAKRIGVRDIIGVFGAAVLVGLALASPWLMRNQMLYGDLLAQTIYKATGPNPAPSLISQAVGWDSADYVRNAGLRSFVSFWYFLDPSLPLVPLARFIGPAPLLLLVLALALVPLGGIYGRAKRHEFEEGEGGLVGFLSIVPLCLLPFFVKFLYEVFQAQGRYLLPALLAVAAVCTYGFSTLGRRGLAFVPAVVLLGITLWQLAHGGYVAVR